MPCDPRGGSASYRRTGHGIAPDRRPRPETAPDARDAALLTASAVPALLIAGEGNRIVLASPSFLDLSGWTAEAAAGAETCHVLRPDGDRETAVALSAALAGERPGGVEILGLTRQGTTYWAQVLVSPCRAWTHASCR